MIKPYYEEPGITIYHGDCLSILPELPDKSVDLVLTDPPYKAVNIGRNEKEYDGLGNDVLAMTDGEYDHFCTAWFQGAIQKGQGLIVSTGTRSLWRYPPARWILCWHKPGAVNYNAFGGFNIWEPILVYGNLKKRAFVQDYFSSTPINLSCGPEKDHPFHKNIHLWKWIVAEATDPGVTILDPFMGSGTTLVAAKQLGRKAIGIEIEQKYCDIAIKRLGQEVLPL